MNRVHRYCSHVTGAACRQLRNVAWLLVLCSVLQSCAQPVFAPIEQKSTRGGGAVLWPDGAAERTKKPPPPMHVVRAGETLHEIAWRYGLDFRDVVNWNALRNPDRITVGQRLRLRPPPSGAKSSSVARDPVSSGQQKNKPKESRKRISPPAQPADEGKRRWVWPADGDVKKVSTKSGRRGIEIHGARNQSVKAASDGKVVYSGNGLRGYGELIIVQHDEQFLSAYAHNDIRMVDEGEVVKRGQPIAKLGSTEARTPMLHFEIRLNGKAVDPLVYLPKR